MDTKFAPRHIEPRPFASGQKTSEDTLAEIRNFHFTVLFVTAVVLMVTAVVLFSINCLYLIDGKTFTLFYFMFPPVMFGMVLTYIVAGTIPPRVHGHYEWCRGVGVFSLVLGLGGMVAYYLLTNNALLRGSVLTVALTALMVGSMLLWAWHREENF